MLAERLQQMGFPGASASPHDDEVAAVRGRRRHQRGKLVFTVDKTSVHRRDHSMHGCSMRDRMLQPCMLWHLRASNGGRTRSTAGWAARLCLDPGPGCPAALTHDMRAQ